MCFFLATFFAFNLSAIINWPPYYIIEAVPNLRSLPLEVTGRVVPGRCPCIAVVRLARLLPVTGLFVPGL
jgi:hypothetical protein